MESYYILIVAVLFFLAISDLIVGVSNDAVNFLNSAIGSRAASFRVIILIAAAGVIIGASFSNGMMEVARKGVFHPGEFSFDEIMVLFLAVMMTDILLLDFFNTMGLPTSTTVSIVFELLGASVAVALYKIRAAGEGAESMVNYINTDRALGIIAGIFLSVIIAFTVGMIVQWLVRLAFTFRVGKTLKYWGGLWGGISITAIFYFLLIKGAKGSTLVTDEAHTFIVTNTGSILLVSLIAFTIIFQLLLLFSRLSVLKITVLIGTFALAMAFAGNDLVNFIGVPLAGYESFKAFAASGMSDPSGFFMSALAKPVNTPIYFLIAAGLIMVITLRLSRKAKSVTATTIDLSRQGEGSERFQSTLLARFLVRRSVEISTFFDRITPGRIKRILKSRFSQEEEQGKANEESLAFDLVRASVNLVVASILIAFGTSLKLPLSTTYVTFMVAMGTSLSDGAWGRESAVYRITGVLTVVGGWFFTAFSAFSASFIIATIIYFGKLPVILVMIALAVFVVFRTHAVHRKRVALSDKKKEASTVTESVQVLNNCEQEVKSSVIQISKLLFLAYHSFSQEHRNELKSIRKQSKKLNKSIDDIKEGLPGTLKTFKENEIETGHHYVLVVDHLKESSNSLYHIVRTAFNHVNNNHPLDKEQSKELLRFNEEISEFFNFTLTLLQKQDYEKLDELVKKRDDMITLINTIIRNRIKILKKKQKGTKVSMTYIEMLTETKTLLLQIVELLRSSKELSASIQRKAVGDLK